MGYAGGELSDGGQLIGAQQLALMLLGALGHLFNLADYRLHFAVEALKIAVGRHANRGHVVIEMLRDHGAVRSQVDCERIAAQAGRV
jgi:hypothetical protein